jgi:peptide chain release factor 2
VLHRQLPGAAVRDGRRRRAGADPAPQHPEVDPWRSTNPTSRASADSCRGSPPSWASSGGIFDVGGLKRRVSELESLAGKPDFWDKPSEAQEVLKETKAKSSLVDTFEALDRKVSDAVVLLELAEEAGIKNATLVVEGPFAFGLLKAESGVHRLVRISPFDGLARRQTSFAAVTVMPDVEEDIDVDINEVDLRIDYYRAGGAGGQHVNKTDSAVRLTHLPTGLVVQCQNERSQHKNKSQAMRVLRSRLYDLRKAEADAKAAASIERKKIEWGSQIRSYVLAPYQQVTDHRTELKIGKVDAVLDGDLDELIRTYLLQEGSQSART